MYYVEPKGSMKGKLNLLGCKVTASSSSSNGFEITTSKSSVTFRCESEQVKNSWISVICRAKEKTLEERKKLLEEWSKEGDCMSCIAALASEQAEQEEQEEAVTEVQVAQSDTQEFQKNATSEVKAQENEAISELLNLPLASVEEQVMTLKDTFKKEIVLVALLRHFG